MGSRARLLYGSTQMVHNDCAKTPGRGAEGGRVNSEERSSREFALVFVVVFEFIINNNSRVCGIYCRVKFIWFYDYILCEVVRPFSTYSL